MAKVMQIVIPSSHRPDRVFAKNFVPKPWRDELAIVVPPDQHDEYVEHNPNINIVSCPVTNNTGAKRQWIFEHFDTHKYLAMIDDDAKFFYRTDLANTPQLTTIKDLPNQQTLMWMTLIDTLNMGYAWTAISYRNMNNNFFIPYQDNCRGTGAWAINRDILLRENIRFDHTRVMEDVQVILSLLTSGYENRIYFKWAFNQLSNSKGGCSTWRTPNIQARAARKIAAKFPRYVTLKNKTVISECWYGKNTTVTDIRVLWKKAHKENSL